VTKCTFQSWDRVLIAATNLRHTQIVAVWRLLRNVGILGSAFVDGPVTSEVLFCLLRDQSALYLQLHNITMNSLVSTRHHQDNNLLGLSEVSLGEVDGHFRGT
jgi:hypothetical protein